MKIWRQDSGEKAWWLDANDNNIPDEELNSKEPEQATSPGPQPSSTSLSRKSSTSRSFRSTSKKANRLRHQQSGERAWWMSDDPSNVPEGIEVIPVSTATETAASTSSSYDSKPLARLRHVDSGEKAWWLDSSSNVPEGVQRLSADPSNTSDSSESFERSIEIVSHTRTPISSFARFPSADEPLGDRASPEGVSFFYNE